MNLQLMKLQPSLAALFALFTLYGANNMGAAEKIQQLEAAIESMSLAAQYAEGQTYRDEMRRISEMRQQLSQLKTEAANEPELDDPFADDDIAALWAEHDNDAVTEREAGKAFMPGLYLDLSNEDYHRSPGISKSGLDRVASNPSTYIWQAHAPVDLEKLDALDAGTALHCALLS
jgi:hypothetical protein